MKSYEEARPIDSSGQPIPWMNYSAIKFLRDRLNSECRLFEFGSGYSTAFYAALVRDVTSVEYDESWFHLVKGLVPKNVTLIHREKDVDGAYCRSIIEAGCCYDIVVVDGRDRVNCILQSLTVLSEKGILLLDDSQRGRYQPGLDHAREKGFRSIEFEGLKPGWVDVHRTTILYRNDNCLGI